MLLQFEFKPISAFSGFCISAYGKARGELVVSQKVGMAIIYREVKFGIKLGKVKNGQK